MGHEHHEHEHGESHNHAREREFGVVSVEAYTHDGAIVVSAELALAAGDADAVRVALGHQIELIARELEDLGGIIGHIKAAVRATETEALSCTDARGGVVATRAPGVELDIGLVAIVFAAGQDETEALVRAALEAVRDAANKHERRETIE
jgi:hypothetical protein